MNKRVFLIVLDSFGIGELPDAYKFNDEGSNTLASCAKSKYFSMPNMKKFGLFNIDGVDLCKEESPVGSFGRLAEKSMGKDTTTGHWEMSGLILPKPFPTYPSGFPKEVLDEFEKRTHRGTLVNMPYSGTKVINDYGEEHLKTGKLIVYTSADSVFQIAAHEDIVPLEELYHDCEIAREILNGEHGVGRVIARPFTGKYPDFERTSGRHDYSLEPFADTMLDVLKSSGKDVIGVGKINDIFAGKGITESHRTVSNADGMKVTSEIAKRDFDGLCFVNLVDFDMKYGHRNDVDGYAKALNEFDTWLGEFVKLLRKDDILIITADHGCDPATESTDHSREYIPMVAIGNNIKDGANIGTRETYSDIGSTIIDYLGCSGEICGQSFLDDILKDNFGKEKAGELVSAAFEARKFAYAPYSKFCVGAALLTDDNEIFTGCNIENASYSPTNCAERTAVFKAVSEGKKNFKAIAIVGGNGHEGDTENYTSPCGVCRQVLAEFNDGSMKVILAKSHDDFKIYRLKDLLPLSFTPNNLV